MASEIYSGGLRVKTQQTVIPWLKHLTMKEYWKRDSVPDQLSSPGRFIREGGIPVPF